MSDDTQPQVLEALQTIQVSQLPAEMQAMFEIEKARIASNDKRTEVTLRAIEAGDADNKRMFEYHVKKLEQAKEADVEKLKIIKNVIYGGCAVGALILGSLFYLLFLGNDAQSQLASTFLDKIATGFGGIGAFLLLRIGFNTITSSSSEE